MSKGECVENMVVLANEKEFADFCLKNKLSFKVQFGEHYNTFLVYGSKWTYSIAF